MGSREPTPAVLIAADVAVVAVVLLGPRVVARVVAATNSPAAAWPDLSRAERAEVRVILRPLLR